MAILMKGEPEESITLGLRHLLAADIIENAGEDASKWNCLYGTMHVWLHFCKLNGVGCWGFFQAHHNA